MSTDRGASVPDRATHEPSPSGLGHSVSVPSAKHTTGPWQVVKAGRAVAVTTTNGGFFGEFTIASWADPAAIHDANLIAAAPDMLAGLKMMVAHYVNLAGCGDCGNWDPEDEDEVRLARAIIATAQGTEARRDKTGTGLAEGDGPVP